MNILADASLPGLKQAFPEPFQLTLYHHPEEIVQLLPEQKILLCRASLKVNSSLLKNHSLRYVATASSGTDHLDQQFLASQNIQVIDAKGANAQAVADYVIASLAFLRQHTLISGNKAGIIGLGKVGTQVAARLEAANFQICTYDPPKAQREPHLFQSCTLDDLHQVDLLCIHAELHNTQPFPSAHLINEAFLNQLKPGCVIINAARGGIVDEEALLNTPNPFSYCTDVYLNEPKVDKRIIDKALLCTPHIAGHSLEAKYTAITMISEKLHQLENLPMPQCCFFPQSPHISTIKKAETWYESVLKIYNPLTETLQLKQALNTEIAFLNLRKKHQNRHNFSLYFTNANLNPKTRLLLGM